MTKKAVFILFFLSISLITIGQGITFTAGSWEAILQKAKLEKKPIFIDAYTDWCGPCKKMDQEVFTEPEAGRYFNTTFISYKLNMEKGEGIEFAKKYDVYAFPTLLYFNSEGELINKSVGYKDVGNLIRASKEALDPKNQIGSFKKEYENSDQSLNNLIVYAEKLRKADNYKMAREIVMKRLDHLKRKEKYTEEEWTLVTNYLRDYSSPLFKKFLVNRNKYKKIAEPEQINKYIHSVLANPGVFNSIIVDSGRTLAKYVKEMKKLSQYINSEFYTARAEYFANLDTDELTVFKYASNFLDRDYELDYDDGKMAYFLAYMGNRYLDKDGQFQEAAERWARKSINLDDKEYKGRFGLAQILFKQEKFREALTLSEEASIIEKGYKEAGVIKDLFKVKEIAPFIEKTRMKIKEESR